MKIPFFSKKNEETEERKKTLYQTADMREYLPIGSVVLLKEGDKRLMIFGIIQSTEEDESEEYDYIGVPYPEGNMGDDYQYLFFHEDIDKVYFRGYEDSEREELLERLIEYHKNDIK